MMKKQKKDPPEKDGNNFVLCTLSEDSVTRWGQALNYTKCPMENKRETQRLSQ